MVKGVSCVAGILGFADFGFRISRLPFWRPFAIGRLQFCCAARGGLGEFHLEQRKPVYCGRHVKLARRVGAVWPGAQFLPAILSFRISVAQARDIVESTLGVPGIFAHPPFSM